MKQKLIALVCAALVLAGGCEKKQEEAPPAAAATNSWRMAPELRIPTATTPTDSAEVTDLEIGNDTAVYALLGSQRQIVVYDRDGKMRTAFGKDLLQAPTDIGWRNNLLWVWEPSIRKLTRFQPDGTLAGSTTLLSSSTPVPRLEAFLSDSTLLVQTMPAGGPRLVLRVRNDGTVLDTAAIIPERASPLTIGSGGTVQLNATQPFADNTFVAYSRADGMIVIAHPDSAGNKSFVRVTKVNQVGDTVFSTQLPYQPKRFDNALVAPAVDRLMQENRHNWVGAAPSNDEQKRLLRAALYTPRYLPSITGLLIATDGTILVRREEGTEQVTWTVLNKANGQVIAEQTGPAKARAFVAARAFVFAGEHTPGSIPEIVRYRLLVN